PEVYFADEALGRLRDKGFEGVSDVFRLKHFGGILLAMRRKIGSNAARTDRTHADAMGTQIFGGRSREPEQAPFGRAIDSPAGDCVLPSQGSDVDNMAAPASNHSRRDGLHQQEHGFQVGV